MVNLFHWPWPPNLNPNNTYKEVPTQAHLYQVEQPRAVVEMVKMLRSNSSKN